MKDNIDDLKAKASEERNAIERLLDKVPGFSGYRERSARREADRILRATIAKRLDGVRLELSNVHQELSRDIIKAMDHAEPLGEVDTRLMGLVGKIQAAQEGYAGFFDAVKVNEEDLERVYAFDEGMMEHVDTISAQVADVAQAVIDNGDIAGTIRTLNSSVKEANHVFDTRNETLMGIS